MDDPKLTLMGLLETDWNTVGLGFTPKFNADWYEKSSELPQITITHINTRREHVFLSDDVTTTDRRCTGYYYIDVWTVTSSDQRWAMIEEVNRILKAKCNAPGGDLEFEDISDWVDVDETQTHPKILRSRARVEVLYWS